MASSSCSMSLAIPDTLTQRPSPSLRSGPHMMNIAPVRRAALARTAAEMVSELPTVSMRIENLARAERLLGRWRGLVPRGRSGPHAREVRASNLARSSPGCRTPGLLVRRGRRFFGTLQFNNLDGPPHSTIRQEALNFIETLRFRNDWNRPTAGIRSAMLVGTKPTFNALYSTLPFIELRSGVADTGDIEIAPAGAGSTTPEKGTSHD